MHRKKTLSFHDISSKNNYENVPQTDRKRLPENFIMKQKVVERKQSINAKSFFVHQMSTLENQNSINKQIIKQKQHHCYNHHCRMAKFCVNNEQQQTIYFCQICAVMIACKGFNVIKIQDSTNSNFNSIKQYQRQVQKVWNYVHQRHKSILSNMQNSQLQLIKQSNSINVYFIQLHHQIQIIKQDIIKRISHQQQQLQLLKFEIDKFYEQLLKNTQQLKYTEQDSYKQLKKIKSSSHELDNINMQFQTLKLNDISTVIDSLIKLILIRPYQTISTIQGDNFMSLIGSKDICAQIVNNNNHQNNNTFLNYYCKSDDQYFIGGNLDKQFQQNNSYLL